jgi:tetratricopeptide (TPR) repeat protein
MLAGSQSVRPAAALDFQRAALDICRDLEARDPDEARWRSLCAFVHRGLGDTFLRLDQPRQALEHYQTAVDVLSERVRQDPEDLSFKTELCHSEIGVGEAYAAAGQYEAAVTAWDTAARRLAPTISAGSTDAVLEAYARALVLLDRFEEAAPIIRTLAERGQLGLTLRELIDKKGLKDIP